MVPSAQLRMWSTAATCPLFLKKATKKPYKMANGRMSPKYRGNRALSTHTIKALASGAAANASALIEAEAKNQPERRRALIDTMSTRRRCGDPRAKSIKITQRLDENDAGIKSTNQEETERMIFEENEYRFQLANDAPISKTSSSASWDTSPIRRWRSKSLRAPSVSPMKSTTPPPCCWKKSGALGSR